MFDFAKKLLFARQLNIEKGALTILNHRFMMIPAKTFTNIIKSDPKSARYLYYGAKESGGEYADVLIKAFSATTTQKLEELLINTFNLAGWGELEIIKNDMKEKFAVFHIKNSSVAMEFRTSKKPVCHTNRGFLAGGASRIYKADIDCVETSCTATGNALCEFIAAKKKSLGKYAMAKEQI